MAFGRHKWRERAFREVRDELDRFLNYPLNEKVELGDYGPYDNRHCSFDWKGNLKDFGITVTPAGIQNNIVEDYATEGAVTVEQAGSIPGAAPSVHISFDRKAALVFRSHKMTLEKVQLSALENSINAAINKGRAWSSEWVIITHLWLAEGFTQLVSGGSKSEIKIEATIPGVAAGFNLADPALGLNVTHHTSMSYQALAVTSVRPYFTVHKLRQEMSGNWKLYRYGSDQ